MPGAITKGERVPLHRPSRPRRHLLLPLLTTTLVAVVGSLLVTAPWAPDPDTRWRAMGQPLGDVTRVDWITGPDSPNETADRWNVYGTDLGHPVLHHGKLYLVFGDTWGADGQEGDDWRSNGIARLASPDPRDGVTIAEMVTDEAGWSAELLPSAKVDGVEKTVIPTHGISVGDRMVLHFMSVRRWLDDGDWEVGHAGLAVSDDDGRTWQVVDDAVLPGDGDFTQVAMVDDGEHVLVYGIPAGRSGDAHLARARGAALTDLASWEYWDGAGWSPRPEDADPVVSGPVGELSVRWNEHLGRWIMLTLDERFGAIVLRTATTPTGPWSDPVLVTAAEQYPRLYAPYLLPGADTGDDLYFTMSQFGPYQVALMRVRLSSLVLATTASGDAADV